MKLKLGSLLESLRRALRGRRRRVVEVATVLDIAKARASLDLVEEVDCILDGKHVRRSIYRKPANAE